MPTYQHPDGETVTVALGSPDAQHYGRPGSPWVLQGVEPLPAPEPDEPTADEPEGEAPEPEAAPDPPRRRPRRTRALPDEET